MDPNALATGTGTGIDGSAEPNAEGEPNEPNPPPKALVEVGAPNGLLAGIGAAGTAPSIPPLPNALPPLLPPNAPNPELGDADPKAGAPNPLEGCPNPVDPNAEGVTAAWLKAGAPKADGVAAAPNPELPKADGAAGLPNADLTGAPKADVAGGVPKAEG